MKTWIERHPSWRSPATHRHVISVVMAAFNYQRGADVVGRRYGTFRSGDIAESLGVALLKSIATVSEIPRQEDVGIDAVANLLRAESDGSLYAEDSFTIQSKSYSSEKLQLTSHEVDWFMNLSVPHFVGRVDRASASLELFATHFGRPAVLMGQVNELEFRFKRERAHDLILESCGCAHYLEENRGIVWLGDPVIRVSLPERRSDVDLERTYSAMKSFLWAERIAMQFSHLGLVTALKWETDQGVVDVTQVGFVGRRVDDGLPDLVGSTAPLMFGLLVYGLSMGERALGNDLARSIQSVAAVLEEAGIGDASAKQFAYWQQIYRNLLLRHSPRGGS